MPSLPITSVFNDGYIEEMYESFQRDPASVDESWRQYFRMAGLVSGTGGAAGGSDPALLRKAAGAASLLGAIQRFGHFAVQLDPLGSPPPGPPSSSLNSMASLSPISISFRHPLSRPATRAPRPMS